jgi:hypothetical protein
MTFFAYHCLSLPEQARLLGEHGRLLATRQEGGIRQHLYDLHGFFVEAWQWSADEAAIDLIHSFTDLAGLDQWLLELEVRVK